MRVSILDCVFLGFMALAVSGCSSAPTKDGAQNVGYTETGKASYYADKFQSKKTASGERFDQSAYTAAHKKLPFGTRVKVTNIENGKSVIVRINDRGPFVKGRIIDLSRSAFNRIGNTRAGVIKVKIQVVN
jgi:rare lipoprotein A